VVEQRGNIPHTQKGTTFTKLWDTKGSKPAGKTTEGARIRKPPVRRGFFLPRKGSLSYALLQKTEKGGEGDFTQFGEKNPNNEWPSHPPCPSPALGEKRTELRIATNKRNKYSQYSSPPTKPKRKKKTRKSEKKIRRTGFRQEPSPNHLGKSPRMRKLEEKKNLTRRNSTKGKS